MAARFAVPKGRARLLAVSAAYMHLFKLGWELPYDDPGKLRRKLWINQPIRFDTVIGLGVPPGLRLQRALRARGQVSALDRAVTVVYGSWFSRTSCSATCSCANRSTWRAPARALTLSEVSPLYGAIGWTYFAAASFAIVYLGEHYVADVVVGLAVAELVRRDEPITAPFVRAVARAVQ